MDSLSSRLAVCSWSLQPENPEQLIRRLAETGIRRVQLALDPLRDEPAIWGNTPTLLAREGIEIVSGMFGTIGEDYSTLESIRRTGGIVPDEHWDANWRNINLTAGLAAQMGLKLVTFHAGFLPHEPGDPAYARLAERLQRVADLFGERTIHLGLETGQETAETLQTFLSGLGRPNLGVNFDPANLLLYDKGEPLGALRRLGPWLKQVHIKDARRTQRPGEWGEEVVVGTGEVPWPAFFETLRELGYRGALCIEREAGSQRVADIRTAANCIRAIEESPSIR